MAVPKRTGERRSPKVAKSLSVRTLSDLAAQGQELWSIVVHFPIPDGFEFDYVLERGVSTEDLPAALTDCGRSHRFGSVVQ